MVVDRLADECSTGSLEKGDTSEAQRRDIGAAFEIERIAREHDKGELDLEWSQMAEPCGFASGYRRERDWLTQVPVYLN